MSSAETEEWNVARYLAARLKQLGLRDVFGVPGDHLGAFLSAIERTEGALEQPWHLTWIGEPTEIIAGYAADGYARVKGIGAVGVTYGVGALSLMNPIGGSYAEMIPVVVINGSPGYEARLNLDAVGLLTSHMSMRKESNVDAYRPVTVATEVIANGALAPWQIDSALTIAVTEQRPVYLEVYDDTWSAPCHAPAGTLGPQPRPLSPKSHENCAKAICAVKALIESMNQKELIFWGGIELIRYGLEEKFKQLVESTKLFFASSLMGKTVLSEWNPRFVGIYNGKASDPEVRERFETAPCRIALGTWNTSKDLEGVKVWEKNIVHAAHHGVHVNQEYFPGVELGQFIEALEALLTSSAVEYEPYNFFAPEERELADPLRAAAGPSPETTGPTPQESFFGNYLPADEAPPELTFDSFFTRMNQFVKDATTEPEENPNCPYWIISDAGFSLIGSQIIRMAEPLSYYSQTSWLAIGYSVGGATGLKVAKPEKRVLVFVGDGSFQETCQALSTQTRLGHNTVVFVLNNQDFYGIEQMLVNPSYYAGKSRADYYNMLHPWSYAKLAEVFGSTEPGGRRMTGFKVTTEEELDRVLGDLVDPAHSANLGPILVQVVVPRTSFPKAIKYKVDKANDPKAP